MKKEDYIKMRNAGKFDLNLFWSYYQEKGGYIKDPNKFQKYFLHEFEEVATPVGKVQVMRGERNIQEILNSFDKVLGLTTLYDKDNNFIKVVG